MASCTGRNLFHVIKITHSKSSNKINIPIDIARAIGIDKAEHVIIVKKGENKAEIKRYDGLESYKEYVDQDSP